MKKMIMAITILFVALNANACSICGAGIGNLYLGLYPSFDTKFIGLRYTYSDYRTLLKNDNTQFSNNTFNSFEIYSGINFTKKWQLYAFIPYQKSNQVSDDGSGSNQGLGDITILTNYQMINQRKVLNNKKLLIHNMWIGGGVKFGSGTFNIDPHNPSIMLADVNTQMGTGSNDFILNLRDIHQIDKLGLATTVSFNFNTKNKLGYQYGDKFTLNSIAYFNFNHKNATITPNIGLKYENVAGNKLDGILILLTEGIDNGSYHTGGKTLSGIGGVEFSIKKISLGVNINLPIQQNVAASQVNLKWKGFVHMTYSF